MKSKKVTIEKIAVMVGKGFAGVDKQFEKVATKIEMEKEFKEVNKKLDRIENNLLKKHEDDIAYLKSGVRILENAMGIE